MAARRRGGRFEDALAERLGLRRVGQAGGPIDLVSDRLAVQCKVSAARFPGWIWAALPPPSALRARIVAVAEHDSLSEGRVLLCIPLDDWPLLVGALDEAPPSD